MTRVTRLGIRAGRVAGRLSLQLGLPVQGVGTQKAVVSIRVSPTVQISQPRLCSSPSPLFLISLLIILTIK